MADYLLQPIANDNRPPSRARDWVMNSLGIGGCILAQYVWSAFLFSQFYG